MQDEQHTVTKPLSGPRSLNRSSSWSNGTPAEIEEARLAAVMVRQSETEIARAARALTQRPGELESRLSFMLQAPRDLIPQLSPTAIAQAKGIISRSLPDDTPQVSDNQLLALLQFLLESSPQLSNPESTITETPLNLQASADEPLGRKKTTATNEAATNEAAQAEILPDEVSEQTTNMANPVETAPVETAPVETAPVETAPVETAPVETAPVETAPVETAPVETAPVETAPVAHKMEDSLIDTHYRILVQYLKPMRQAGELTGFSIERNIPRKTLFRIADEEGKVQNASVARVWEAIGAEAEAWVEANRQEVLQLTSNQPETDRKDSKEPDPTDSSDTTIDVANRSHLNHLKQKRDGNGRFIKRASSATSNKTSKQSSKPERAPESVTEPTETAVAPVVKTPVKATPVTIAPAATVATPQPEAVTRSENDSQPQASGATWVQKAAQVAPPYKMPAPNPKLQRPTAPPQAPMELLLHGTMKQQLRQLMTSIPINREALASLCVQHGQEISVGDIKSIEAGKARADLLQKARNALRSITRHELEEAGKRCYSIMQDVTDVNPNTLAWAREAREELRTAMLTDAEEARKRLKEANLIEQADILEQDTHASAKKLNVSPKNAVAIIRTLRDA